MHAIACLFSFYCSCLNVFRPYKRRTAKDCFFPLNSIVWRRFKNHIFHTSSVCSEKISAHRRVATVSSVDYFREKKRWIVCHRMARNAFAWLWSWHGLHHRNWDSHFNGHRNEAIDSTFVFFVSFQFFSSLSSFLFSNSIYLLQFSSSKLDLSPLRWTIIHRFYL